MAIYFKYTKHCVCVFIFLVISTQTIFSQLAEDLSPPKDEAEQGVTQGDSVEITEDTLFFDSQENPDIEVKTIGLADTLRIFLVLIFILGIAIGLVWLLKRFQNNQHNINSAVINVVSSKMLAQNSSLHIVKVARGYILIAHSSQNVTLIKEYLDKEDIDEIELSLSKEEAEAVGNNSDSFLKKLQKRLSLQNNMIFQHGFDSGQRSKNSNSILANFIDKNSIFRKGTK